MRISDWSSDVCSSDLERRRYANLKPSGSSPTGHPAIDCLDHSLTQNRRKSSCHEGWPPSPALTVNHKSMPKGILPDSATSKNALAAAQAAHQRPPADPALPAGLGAPSSDAHQTER